MQQCGASTRGCNGECTNDGRQLWNANGTLQPNDSPSLLVCASLTVRLACSDGLAVSLPLLWQLLLPYGTDLQRCVSALDTLPAAEVGSAGRIPPRRPDAASLTMAGTVPSPWARPGALGGPTAAAEYGPAYASAAGSGVASMGGSSTGPPHEELLAFVDVDAWSGRAGLTASEFADFASGALDAARGLWQRPASQAGGAASTEASSTSSLGATWQLMAHAPSPVWRPGAERAALVPYGISSPASSLAIATEEGGAAVRNATATAATTVRTTSCRPAPWGAGLDATRGVAPSVDGVAATTLTSAAGSPWSRYVSSSRGIAQERALDVAGAFSPSMLAESGRTGSSGPWRTPSPHSDAAGANGSVAEPRLGLGPAYLTPTMASSAPGVHLPSTGARTLAPPPRMPVRVLPVHTAR